MSREVQLPDGWRPAFKQCAFGNIVLTGVVQVKGGTESYTEADAHFALAKLLEHRDHVDEAIRNVRLVLAEHNSAPQVETGSVQAIVGDLRSALDASFSCVDESNAKILAPKVDAALERADRFLGKPPRE